MFLGHLLFALVIALVLAVIFGAGFCRYRWGADLVLFFILLFLFTWAGGLWVLPFGPLAWDIPFFSFLFVGIVVALLLAALAPAPGKYPRSYESPKEARRETRDAAIAFGIFFWILIIGLVVLIILGYAA
jgi:hypothetical protein